MLLPSSIHRAEDFVGMAMPMLGLLCANAPLSGAMAAGSPARAQQCGLPRHASLPLVSEFVVVDG